MTQHKEYPKTLVHPAYQPAINATDYAAGSPVRFAPVIVHDADQEDQYKAKGYNIAGRSDAVAYERSIRAPEPEAFEYNEWPKWVDGDLVEGPEHAEAVKAAKLNREYPKWVDGQLVANPEEEAALPSVIARKAAEAAAEEAEELALLEKLATKRGLLVVQPDAEGRRAKR